jgi:hypothetical protein
MPCGDPGSYISARPRPFIGERPGARRRQRPIWQGSGYECAAAAEQLVSAGHDLDAVMKYTPRQLQAFLFIASKRRQRELAEMLQISTLAARGEEKAVREQLRALGE